MPQLVIGQPYPKGPDGSQPVDETGKPLIYHGQLINTERDSQGRTVWTFEDGTKQYARPTDDQGHILKAPDSGGIWREEPTWNPQTGQYDKGGLDWGNILGLITGGIMSGGLAASFLGGGAAGGAGAAEAGASAPEAGGAISSLLPSTTTTAGSAALPTGLASGTSAAAGAGGDLAASMGADLFPNGIGAANDSWDAAGNFVGPSSITSPIDAGNGGSFMSKLLGSKTNLADAGQLLGKFAAGQQNNRFARANMSQDYNRDMLLAQQQRNNNESDAMKKLAQTSYIMGGGANSSMPSALNLGGSNYSVPNPGYGPKAPTAEEIAGAKSLQPQLLDRLKPGGSYTPVPLSDYSNPGVAENIGDYGSLALTAGAFIRNLLGGN